MKYIPARTRLRPTHPARATLRMAGRWGLNSLIFGRIIWLISDGISHAFRLSLCYTDLEAGMRRADGGALYTWLLLYLIGRRRCCCCCRAMLEAPAMSCAGHGKVARVSTTAKLITILRSLHASSPARGFPRKAHQICIPLHDLLTQWRNSPCLYVDLVVNRLGNLGERLWVVVPDKISLCLKMFQRLNVVILTVTCDSTLVLKRKGNITSFDISIHQWQSDIFY